MKKSVLVIVSMFVFSGVAFSSEINVKTSFGCFREMGWDHEMKNLFMVLLL